MALSIKLTSLSAGPETADSSLTALMRESSWVLTLKLPAVVRTWPSSPSMNAWVNELTRLLDSTKPMASPPLASGAAPELSAAKESGDSASELVSLLTCERM